MNSKNIGEKLTISFLEKNMEKYRKVYSMLEDEASKEAYLNRIKRSYLEQDISHIVCNAGDIYFDEQIRLSEEEVFVDCGGYDGDTAIRFVNRTNGKFKKIIIFEPERSKEGIIKKSSDTILKFDARGDCGSAIYEFGNDEIAVKTLDGTVFEDAPTYIKMDIEGSELED